jgi:hypothetical protein
VCKDYLGVLSEEALRKNFALVYEIVDEALDYGYAQTCATTELQVRPISCRFCSVSSFLSFASCEI